MEKFNKIKKNNFQNFLFFFEKKKGICLKLRSNSLTKKTKKIFPDFLNFKIDILTYVNFKLFSF